jgi:hypothetical protein
MSWKKVAIGRRKRTGELFCGESGDLDECSEDVYHGRMSGGNDQMRVSELRDIPKRIQLLDEAGRNVLTAGL